MNKKLQDRYVVFTAIFFFPPIFVGLSLSDLFICYIHYMSVTFILYI